MYIAFNGCERNGFFLGDSLISVKMAYLFVENEKYKNIKLSLCEGSRLNFFWDKFISVYKPEILWDKAHDSWESYLDLFNKRKKLFNSELYKEIYPRMLGGSRQTSLCGKENEIGKDNIFEYFYFGQETFNLSPKNTKIFDKSIFNFKWVGGNKILINPHEKCFSNRYFTLDFWEKLITKMLKYKLEIFINSNHPRFLKFSKFCQVERPDIKTLISIIENSRIVLSGNTGVGWLSAAIGCPLIAFEPKNIGFWGEYSFQKSGLSNLLHVVHSNNDNNILEEICFLFTRNDLEFINVDGLKDLEGPRNTHAHLTEKSFSYSLSSETNHRIIYFTKNGVIGGDRDKDEVFWSITNDNKIEIRNLGKKTNCILIKENEVWRGKLAQNPEITVELKEISVNIIGKRK